MTPDTLNSLKELTLSFFFFSVLACTCSSLFNDLSLRSRDPFRPLRCTRSPNGIAKVLLFFYSANFFRIFLKFFLSPHHITPPGPPEAGPGCSILATEMILRRRNRCCRDRLARKDRAAGLVEGRWRDAGGMGIVDMQSGNRNARQGKRLHEVNAYALTLREIHLEPAIIDYQTVNSGFGCR